MSESLSNLFYRNCTLSILAINDIEGTIPDLSGTNLSLMYERISYLIGQQSPFSII